MNDNAEFLAELIELCKKHNKKLVGTCLSESISGEIVIMDNSKDSDRWSYDTDTFYSEISKDGAR